MKKGDYSKRGQVWIETVIYTLIALTLIGAVLAFATPKIKEIEDKAIVEQSINMMQSIDSVVSSIVQGGAGNKRIIDVSVKRGALSINSTSDKIIFELQSGYKFSETGEQINIGGIDVVTVRLQNVNNIILSKNYTSYDIQYNGKNESKSLTQSTTPYRITIENKGGTKPVLNFVVG